MMINEKISQMQICRTHLDVIEDYRPEEKNVLPICNGSNFKLFKVPENQFKVVFNRISLAEQSLQQPWFLMCIAKQTDLSTLLLIRQLNKNLYIASEKAANQLWNTLINDKEIKSLKLEFSKIEKYKVLEVTERKKPSTLSGFYAYQDFVKVFFGPLSLKDIPLTVEKFIKKTTESFQSIEKCWNNGLAESIYSFGVKKINESHKNSGLEIKLYIENITKYEKDKLDLKIMNFEKLELRIFCLPQCTIWKINKLELKNNKIEIFPITELAHLEHLDLNYNNLRSIDLSGCRNLKYFSMNNNLLTEFPKGIKAQD